MPPLPPDRGVAHKEPRCWSSDHVDRHWTRARGGEGGFKVAARAMSRVHGEGFLGACRSELNRAGESIGIDDLGRTCICGRSRGTEVASTRNGQQGRGKRKEKNKKTRPRIEKMGKREMR